MINMKRLFYCAGLVLTICIFEGCAQHDTTSPSTSGNTPVNQPGAGVDTSGATPPNTMATPNTANDQSNNNKQINTADSLNKRQ
jgi:hypothetical protein